MQLQVRSRKPYAVECSGPVFKVNQNFSYSVFGFLNISFEPEFGNLNLETRVLKPHIQFCFSVIASAVKPEVLRLHFDA